MILPPSLRRLVVAGLALAVLSSTAPGFAQDTATPSDPEASATGEAGTAKREQGTGLPLPRFVSLARDEVNLRAGPGEEYPIRWVLRRRGMPVKIVGERKEWRQVVDMDGSEGWIHSRLLSSRRTVVITGGEVHALRRSAALDARVVVRAESGVIGTLIDCDTDWCLVELSDRRGWIERSSIWGVLDDEMRE